MANYLFTSESVTEGHPDKICDQISDSVLDEVIRQDPNSRVACETFTKTGFVLVGGEITTTAEVDIPSIARNTIRDIGYTDNSMGIDHVSCGVLSALDRQSPDIAQGVDRGDPDEQGAGDQGLMFGYACNETASLMPLPIQLAHKLAIRLARVRKERLNGVDFIRPDGKTQVSVIYEHHKPVAITSVVVSTQHTPEVTQEQIQEAVHELVIKPIVPAGLLNANTDFHINPTGRFVVGGPQGDSGLTGRKIIVDTYGGMARHGGGAFSGKDPSKVDRSATYYARYIAKHVVAAGLAERCEVQLAYAIGLAKPMSILVETFGTGIVPDVKLTDSVQKVFDARPGPLIRELNLRRPIFRQTAAYGHFGREGDDFTWEKTPRIGELRDACGVRAEDALIIDPLRIIEA
ncbi:methionine adenosyltransferase [Haliangium sp.]|uniref:methionine adenosyltransferase n=1 Tax=Haliangium sp. TaxID=2663208 RepID=UPI003D097DBB